MNIQELMQLLPQVLSSWEVLVVTIVLVLYFFLVFYVARLYRRPKSFSMIPRQKRVVSPKESHEKPAEPEIED